MKKRLSSTPSPYQLTSFNSVNAPAADSGDLEAWMEAQLESVFGFGPGSQQRPSCNTFTCVGYMP